MSARSMQKAIPTLLAVVVFSMMAAGHSVPGPALAENASSAPTPYSADHARIAPDLGTQEAPPTF